MEYSTIIANFKKILEERFPGGYNYIPLLAGILDVDIRTIQRKMRGDTHFSIEELLTIGEALDLSMAKLLDHNHSSEHPLGIYIRDFSDQENYEKIVKSTLDAHIFAAESDHSKYMVVSNTVPDVTYAHYQEVSRFTYFKWLYFNKGPDCMIPFSEIQTTATIQRVHENYLESILNMKASLYILNLDIMRNIANEIRLFYRMHYLSREECLLIIGDCMKIVDKMNEICETGLYPDRKREISMYYTEILLPNDMAIIDSDNIKFAIIYAHIRNPIVTKSLATFGIMKDWVRSLQRSANIISLSGGVQRSFFMSRQRECLEELRAEINTTPGF